MYEQTQFNWGYAHYSPTHQNHWYGCTAPVQRDLHLTYSTGGLYQNLGGVPINTGPSGFQTNLGNFGFRGW